MLIKKLGPSLMRRRVPLAYVILHFLLGANLLLFPGAGNNSEISGHIPCKIKAIFT
jgi:hypothetical protein